MALVIKKAKPDLLTPGDTSDPNMPKAAKYSAPMPMAHDARPGMPTTSKPAVKAHAKKKKHNVLATHFIQQAIKRPGALTAAVGGKPSQHMGAVRSLAANGSPLQKRQADFYLNVLSKVNH